jgi:F-type H+-transporting ATPase subunit delta
VTNRTAAARYARALLDVALQEQLNLYAVETELTEFNALVQQHDALRLALLNPAVPAPRKRAAVSELVERAGLLTAVGKTLVLLAERDRLVLLPDIIEAFKQRLLDLHNVVRAEVTTATPLSADQLHSIQRSLGLATGRTVDLSARVDPAIVGGMVARVGSTVFDGSVVNHLQRIRQRLEASI